MQVLAYVLSIIGLASVVLSYLLKGKNMIMILILLFLANLFVGLSYLCTGNLPGSLSCFLGAVQCIINFGFESKGKDLPKWLIAVYAVSFIVVNLIVFTRVADILAIIAAMLFIMSILQKNGKQYRFWNFMNVAVWCIYDIICGTYGPLITHSIQFFTLISGMLIHDRKKEDN